MSIEINNESGAEVGEENLVSWPPTCSARWASTRSPSCRSWWSTSAPWPSCTRSGWASRARPTCSPSPWTSCDRAAGRAATPTSPTDPALLGDVVLCPPVAGRQADEAGHSAQDELELLCTHGILHLLGYDHAEPEEHKEMFGLQARLLDGWREVRSRGERLVALAIVLVVIGA